MDFSIVFDKYRELAERRLMEHTPSSEPRALYEPMRYLLEGGGKRIRPVLTMAAAAAAGAAPETALNCAAALEILHNFTLAHDDIMDRSPLRRGRETLHKKYNDATAILTGDVMLGVAYSILPKPSEHLRSGEINESFTRALIEVCEGQAYDMQFNQEKNITMDDYLLMIDKKTSALLVAAAEMGAHMANASINVVKSLSGYARNLGIAFQIQDDLLDIVAEQRKFGKKTGQDIIEGKKTFLIIRAREKAKKSQDKELLDLFFDKGGLPEKYVPSMKELFARLGVFSDAQQEIENYFAAASSHLNILPDNEHREMLIWILNKLNKRAY